MRFSKNFWMATGIMFLSFCGAWAENKELAKPQEVPAGERVAGYLQAYLSKVSTVVEAKSSGGIFDGTQTYRVVVVYEPDQKNLDITLIGMQQNPQNIQDMMDVLRQIVLKLNPKLQRNFGVTLQDTDLSIDYLYAKSGQILMRYREGKYLTGSASESKSSSEDKSKN